MMSQSDQDAQYLALAYVQATRSPDPSTQNGALVVRRDEILGKAHTRFPDGIANSKIRWNDRSWKYRLAVHAEANACLCALRAHGDAVIGATLYCPWYACTECAKTIIQSGIGRIVGHGDARRFSAVHSPQWTPSIMDALDMFAEAGVACEWVDGPIVGAPTIRMSEQIFDPRRC